MVLTPSGSRVNPPTAVAFTGLVVLLVHLLLANWALPQRWSAAGADQRSQRLEVSFVRELAPAQAAAAAPAVPPPRPVALRRLPDLPAPVAQAASAPAVTAQLQAEDGSAPAAPLPAPLPASLPAPLPAPLVAPDLPELPVLQAWSGVPQPALEPHAPVAPETAPPAPPAPAATAAADGPTALAQGLAEPGAPLSAAALADAAAAAEPDARASQPVVWPPSTRMNYRLTGDYRGPVEGQAQVEWLRQGLRYQVHMDLSIGPFFAPLMSRRASSEGLITPQGLRPTRYDEETRRVLREPRRLTVWMDADQVLLPAGRRAPRPPGLQDSASQFVQLTWLFNTRPDLLREGTQITLPLALPRTVQDWVYAVRGTELLYTTFGPVETVHIEPLRPADLGPDLLAEIWVAPSLQYLPVRMRIRQGPEMWIELLATGLPLQAEQGEPQAAPPPGEGASRPP